MNILLYLLIVLSFLVPLKGDSQSLFFKFIESNLNRYRQSLNSEDLSFQNGIIRLELNGRRTNIKSQLLLGYYVVGMALQRSEVDCHEIEVVVKYEMKVGNNLISRAPVNKVIELSQGRLSSEEFFLQINY